MTDCWWLYKNVSVFWHFVFLLEGTTEESRTQINTFSVRVVAGNKTGTLSLYFFYGQTVLLEMITNVPDVVEQVM